MPGSRCLIMWSRATCLPQGTQCLCSLPSLLRVSEVSLPQPAPAWPSLSRSPGPHTCFQVFLPNSSACPVSLQPSESRQCGTTFPDGRAVTAGQCHLLTPEGVDALFVLLGGPLFLSHTPAFLVWNMSWCLALGYFSFLLSSGL